MNVIVKGMMWEVHGPVSQSWRANQRETPAERPSTWTRTR